MRPIRRLLIRSPKWLATCLAAVVASLTTAGCQEPTAPAAPPPPTVGVVESRRMTVPVLATPIGTTRALKEVVIRARVRGFLTERLFEEGAAVEEGQLLFVIEEDQYKVALQSAQADQAEAQAALSKAEQSKIRETSAAQLALSRAQLLLARIQERRARALLARNAGTREEVDQREAERQRWEAEVEAAAATLEQARADYEVGIASARAQVEAAKAAVRNAELNLGYCRMYAPIDGRIGEALVRVGNLVGPEATGGGEFSELASIQQLDPMGVDIEVSSRYLERATKLVQQGLTIRLFRPGLEGEQEHPEPGVVYFIDNRVDPTTATFLSKARVPNPQGTLLPGEYVNIRVVVDQLVDAVVVPAPAVSETEAGPVVYLVDDQGKVAIQSVEAAQTYEGLRVITRGLDARVPVIVEGLQLVRPGVAVRTEPAVVPRPARDESKDAAPGAAPTSAPEGDATKGASPSPAPGGDATKGAAPSPATGGDATKDTTLGPAPAGDATKGTTGDATKGTTQGPAPGRDAAKAAESAPPDRPVVQPGGPRSGVVEAREGEPADRPAPNAGDAPK